MNYAQLQQYLDREKWHESEARGYDMCGRYARCRYCNRYEDYPCAMAHNRLIEVRDSSVPEPIPEWLLPEPPVKEVFGVEMAEKEGKIQEKPVAKQVKKPPVVQEAKTVPAPVLEEVAIAKTEEKAKPAPKKCENKPAPKKPVQKAEGRVRLLTITRKEK